MRLAEITIVIGNPDDPDDSVTEEMIAAYEELDLPGALRDVVDLCLASRTALCTLNVTIIEG